MPSPLRLLADQAFSRAAGAPLVDGNHVALLQDARENYPAWLAAIGSAQHWIHFESYIVHDDRSGREFADALSDAAGRGVRVRVIYDWLGALTTSRAYWQRLRRAGVEVRAFNPPRVESPLGWLSRDHRKTIAVDGRIGFVSGLCVGDMWWGGERARGADPWRDTGVSITGPAVADLEAAFAEVWAACGSPLPDDERANPELLTPTGTTALRVVATKPSTAGILRLDQLVAAVARERLWITDAYFVGTSPYTQALIAAAGDGVDVRLLLPGSSSDLPLVQNMTRAGYRQLLEAGVRVFEWNGTMVHAKTAVADGRWARVGSTNLNVQSWLGNWELDVAVEDRRFGTEMEDMFLRDLHAATEVVLRNRRIALDAGVVTSPTGPHRGRARRAAAAGALRMGRTFGAALTSRRTLGAAELSPLVWGIALLCAVGAVGLMWPKALAYPLGVISLWIAVSWVIQAVKLWRKRGAAAAKPGKRRRESAA